MSRLTDNYFYQSREVSRDRLGNPIYQEVQIGISRGKISRFSLKEKELFKRVVTVQDEKLLTQEKFEIVKESDYVEVDGLRYKIKEVLTYSDRWVTCLVNRYES